MMEATTSYAGGSRARYALPLFLGLILLAAGCDSADDSDPEPDSITGVWRTILSSTFSTKYTLPEAALIDSVRYDYEGTQVFTLDLEEGVDGQVTGTIVWNEGASYTRTEYLDGTPDEDSDVVVVTRTITIESATYDAGILRIEETDDELFDVLFEEAEIAVDEDRAQVEIVRTYLRSQYTFPGGAYDTEFTIPFDLTFERMR